ncbi:MAG: ABC transporter permease subunit [Hyphomicrobiales bacterium]|nr:ABC transporter permease subunit [Hyphomicrobiales bacterium]
MVERPRSPWADALAAFAENRGAVLALAILALIALAGIFAPFVAPHSPLDQFRDAVAAPPAFAPGGSWRFPLGTDGVGRDQLSRVLWGARISLFIGFSVAAATVLTGAALGLATAAIGGWFDGLVMRMMDIVLAVPSLVLAILIVAIVGPSLANTILAIAIVYLPRFVRVSRAAALSELSKDYVTAARAMGASKVRLMLRTVLPNATAPILVVAALGVSDAIIEAAGLGFLGLGAQPPTPEWGAMLADSRDFLRADPWMVAAPGIAILVTVLAINIAGDGLRDALDPKLRRS